MPRKARTASGCLAALLLPTLAACSSSAGPSQSSPSISLVPANPVNVTEHLETGRTTTATLDAKGGTVVATGSDGTSFTLVVPPDALLVSQRISLTPVQTIVGLPYHGGLSAAVHLEPDGLTLFKPATLTIRGNKPAPARYGQIGFEYQGSGTGLHFYPTQQQSGIDFTLMHFTSPGVGGISRQDLNSQLAHPPADNLAQIQQDIAALIATQHQLQVLGSGQALSNEELNARIGAALTVMERVVVIPEVDAATNPGASYESVITALVDLGSWARQWNLLGEVPPDYEPLLARIANVLPALFKSQVNACFKSDDIRAALRAFAIVRFDQILLGGRLGLPLDPVQRCLHFELDFETLQTVLPNAPVGSAWPTVDTHVVANGVPIWHAVFE